MDFFPDQIARSMRNVGCLQFFLNKNVWFDNLNQSYYLSVMHFNSNVPPFLTGAGLEERTVVYEFR